MRVKKGQLDSVDDGLDRSGTTRLLHISSASWSLRLVHEDLPRLPTPASAEPFAATTEFPVNSTALASPTPQLRRAEHRHECSNSLTAPGAVRYACPVPPQTLRL